MSRRDFFVILGRKKFLSLYSLGLCLLTGFCLGWLFMFWSHTSFGINDFSHLQQQSLDIHLSSHSQLTTDDSVYSATYSDDSNTQIQAGQNLYQKGRYSQAIEVWQTAIAKLDRSHQALVYSYLALAHQNLGQLGLEQQQMDMAISLVEDSTNQFIYAQVLNHYGEFLFRQGQLERAGEIWQQSQSLYRKLEDITGELGTQINQARALQANGLYRRARNKLTFVAASLQQQPISQLQVDSLISLGNVLRLTGGFEEAHKNLNQALLLAKKLGNPQSIQLAWFHLGNTAMAATDLTGAVNYYRQALKIQGTGIDRQVQISAQVRLLDSLIQTQQEDRALKIINQLQNQISRQPLTQTIVYTQIELGKSLAQLGKFPDAAKILARSARQADTLVNPRAQSYALGRLANLYEQQQRWDEAKKLTRQAMGLISPETAPEIAYEWEWQMGRLFNMSGDKKDAIIHYSNALNILRSLRQDLASISQDVQFSFRDRVEPVYRQFVDLLLTPENSRRSGVVSQTNIIQARQTIENLQLAELANFFRQACVDTRKQEIEKVDTDAAVIYPIILSDRVEVILSLPRRPLRHYATYIPQQQVEKDLQSMRTSLRRTSFRKQRETIAKKVYTWLIQPIMGEINRNEIKTLVFVLDGSLRNIPVAALFDGNQYLIENYQIAISPSLKLFNPRPLPRDRLQVLIGGLSKASQDFTALPGVQQEIKQIQELFTRRNLLRVEETLLDRQFTTQALKKNIAAQPYSIIHLATHGQFSSKPEDNFILTTDGKLDIQTLDRILSQRQQSNSPPLELLVLSACQTAQGDNRATLGLAGMAIRSGARSTLASLWTINDKSTSQLMIKFYQQLVTQGESRAEALRQAQLYLLKHTQYNHPYFWGSFILVGNWL